MKGKHVLPFFFYYTPDCHPPDNRHFLNQKT